MPLGPELRRGDRGGAASCHGDRERGRGARRPAPGRDQLADVPCLREHRHRRRRVLRRCEERHGARRRWRRRPRPRRQREGGRHHARRRRDGEAGPGGGCPRGDVRRPGGDGRPHGHLLEQARPQPARRRPHRPRANGGGSRGRDRPGRRRPQHRCAASRSRSPAVGRPPHYRGRLLGAGGREPDRPRGFHHGTGPRGRSR